MFGFLQVLSVFCMPTARNGRTTSMKPLLKVYGFNRHAMMVFDEISGNWFFCKAPFTACFADACCMHLTSRRRNISVPTELPSPWVLKGEEARIKGHVVVECCVVKMIQGRFLGTISWWLDPSGCTIGLDTDGRI